MAIVAGDISTYLSGGAANADPDASLGGAKSSVEWAGGVLHDLFDIVSGAENAASDDEYRAIYVQNDHATLTALGMKVYVSAETAGGAALAIAIADEAVDVTIETIADEDTAPSGPTFSTPTTEGAALSIGDLAPGESRGLWLRRTAANTGAVSNDGATLTFIFDTEA
jgi:hypothetical protein